MDLIISPMKVANEWACPLHCKNCYAAGQRAMNVEYELSTAEWKLVLDKCWAAGIPQVTFTGGEPTMRPDLVELVRYARKFVTRLNTSGVTLTSELVHALYGASLDSVQVTFYSADEAVHDQLVGKRGAWQQTVQGIRNAVAAGLNVSVNTPLIRANAVYVATLEFINSLGVRYVTCSGLIPTGAAPATIKKGGALENGELYDILKNAVTYCIQAEMELSFTSPGWLSPGQLKSLGLTYPICGACLSNMAIAPNGAVVPCQSWLDSTRGLGNILTDPWKRIWNSTSCKRIRARAALKNDCPLKEA